MHAASLTSATPLSSSPSASSSIFFAIVVFFMVDFVYHPQSRNQPPDAHLAAIGMFLGYVLTFLIAFPIFPLLWHRRFLNGISWTWRAARLRWWKLILLGIALSAAAQAAEHLFKTPKETTDVLKLLDTPLSAWLTAIFGALIAPLVRRRSPSAASPSPRHRYGL